MPMSVNYEINPNSKEWFDGDTVRFKDDPGDFENMLAWVNDDYAKNGFVMMMVRASMYSDLSLKQIGQVTHMKIEVLSQTNFRKAMKALNLDLSAYEGKCTHPTK